VGTPYAVADADRLLPGTPERHARLWSATIE
jgi:hypothetical protein